MYSLWSQRISGITLKRAASVLRMVSRPRSVRPTGSGPRASQKVASSVKNDAMRSTSRLLKAAEIAFISSGVAMSLLVVVTSGIFASLVASPTIAGYAERSNVERATPQARPVVRPGGLASRMTKRKAFSKLLLRNVAALVYGHLHFGVAAHRATVPKAGPAQ